MSRTNSFPAIAVLLLGWAASAGAQSLGDVAKKEAARRKQVVKPGKTYTNETLRGRTTTPPQTSGSPAPEAGAPAAPAAPETPSTDDAADRRKNEAHWRGRIAKVRESLERAKTFQEALQSRINALTADFTARDDPAQRAIIGSNRQKALAELDRVTKEVAAAEQSIRDIEEEARKAGVPAGWVR